MARRPDRGQVVAESIAATRGYHRLAMAEQLSLRLEPALPRPGRRGADVADALARRRSTRPTGSSSPPGAGTGSSRSSSQGPRRGEAEPSGSWTARGADVRRAAPGARGARGAGGGAVRRARRGARRRGHARPRRRRGAPRAALRPAGSAGRLPGLRPAPPRRTLAAGPAARQAARGAAAGPAAGRRGGDGAGDHRARAGRSTRRCRRRGSRACSRGGARARTCRGFTAGCGGRSWPRRSGNPRRPTNPM